MINIDIKLKLQIMQRNLKMPSKLWINLFLYENIRFHYLYLNFLVKYINPILGSHFKNFEP